MQPRRSWGHVMDDALRVLVEMTESIWQGFRRDLQDVTPAEVVWRPLPQANSISLIIRHLAIEAEWHRASIERGEPMPHETTEELQREIDLVPLEFDANLRALDHAFTAFLTALRAIALVDLESRTKAAYRTPRSPHFLGYHQVMHLAMHWGQINTIRNLYRRARGERARLFPDNPTFPRGEAG
jgi:hypothetical protein